ncbi:MAG: Rrf2 family transcriptional regulator, partial [Chloroflexota bacterium]
MQITRQADYAIRAIDYLARISSNGKTSTAEIAKQQDIPSAFLAKIIAQLALSGIVSTTRGAQGGVHLARPSDEITLLEIVEIIDGPIRLTDCSHTEDDCQVKNCSVQHAWKAAENDLVARLKKTTFANA